MEITTPHCPAQNPPVTSHTWNKSKIPCWLTKSPWSGPIHLAASSHPSCSLARLTCGFTKLFPASTLCPCSSPPPRTLPQLLAGPFQVGLNSKVEKDGWLAGWVRSGRMTRRVGGWPGGEDEMDGWLYDGATAGTTHHRAEGVFSGAPIQESLPLHFLFPLPLPGCYPSPLDWEAQEHPPTHMWYWVCLLKRPWCPIMMI